MQQKLARDRFALIFNLFQPSIPATVHQIDTHDNKLEKYEV